MQQGGDVKTLVRETVDRFGRIDVVVNSAGVSMSARTRLVDTTSAEWHKIIDTNLTGTYLMCREALPHLEKSPDAYILNVQSTGAYASQPGRQPLCRVEIRRPGPERGADRGISQLGHPRDVGQSRPGRHDDLDAQDRAALRPSAAR